jgi:hypothetical protein
LITLVLLFIFCGFSDATCACRSGGSGFAGYDFLGDPAVNMDMSTFDEFVSDNLGDLKSKVPAKNTSELRAKTFNAAYATKPVRNLSLNLNDSSRLSMFISHAVD